MSRGGELGLRAGEILLALWSEGIVSRKPIWACKKWHLHLYHGGTRFTLCSLLGGKERLRIVFRGHGTTVNKGAHEGRL